MILRCLRFAWAVDADGLAGEGRAASADDGAGDQAKTVGGVLDWQGAVERHVPIVTVDPAFVAAVVLAESRGYQSLLPSVRASDGFGGFVNALPAIAALVGQ